MTKLYVISKSDLKKLASRQLSNNRSFVVTKSDLKKLASGQLSSRQSFAVLDGEELDLDEYSSGYSSGIRSFAVLNAEESDLDERAKPAGGHPSTYLYFAMLYLGLFIGFLIATIAADMSSKKHLVFLAGTILFGLVSLFSWIWWYIKTRQHIPDEHMKELPTYDDALQID